MPDPEPEEISDRLRVDNVAPAQSESFFAMLAASAAASGTTGSPRQRTRRTAVARLAAVVLGATLVVSGGAMASAVFLNDTSGDRGPGRMPVEPSTVTGVRSTPTSDASIPAPDLLDEAPTPGQRAAQPDADVGRRPHSGSAHERGAAQGQAADVPPGQRGGQLPRGNGQGHQHQPNANPNGQGQGNPGPPAPGPGNSLGSNPKGNGYGQVGGPSGEGQPELAREQQK